MRIDATATGAKSRAGTIGFLCGVGAAFCWAAGFVAARHGIAVGFSPTDLAAHRFIWAGLILLLPALQKGISDLDGIGWWRGLALTFFGGPVQASISYLGFNFVPLGHGAVIQPACSALSGLLLAAVILGEPTIASRIIGAIAMVLGLVVFGAEALTKIGAHGVGGDLLFVWAGVSWGIFGTLLRRWRIGGTHAAAVVCVVSLLLYGPAHGVLFGYARIIAAGWTENLLQVLAQGLLAGVGAIYLFGRTVTLLGAARASTFPALVPTFALVIGYLALGEVPSVYQLVGLAVVAVGFRFALKQ